MDKQFCVIRLRVTAAVLILVMLAAVCMGGCGSAAVSEAPDSGQERTAAAAVHTGDHTLAPLASDHAARTILLSEHSAGWGDDTNVLFAEVDRNGRLLSLLMASYDPALSFSYEFKYDSSGRLVQLVRYENDEYFPPQPSTMLKFRVQYQFLRVRRQNYRVQHRQFFLCSR